MRKVLVYSLLLLFLSPVMLNATTGSLKSASIITCNGTTYGQHSSDNHWHVASEKGGKYYATGTAFYDHPCPTSVAHSTTKTVETVTPTQPQKVSETVTPKQNQKVVETVKPTKEQPEEAQEEKLDEELAEEVLEETQEVVESQTTFKDVVMTTGLIGAGGYVVTDQVKKRKKQ